MVSVKRIKLDFSISFLFLISFYKRKLKFKNITVFILKALKEITLHVKPHKGRIGKKNFLH